MSILKRCLLFMKKIQLKNHFNPFYIVGNIVFQNYIASTNNFKTYFNLEAEEEKLLLEAIVENQNAHPKEFNFISSLKLSGLFELNQFLNKVRTKCGFLMNLIDLNYFQLNSLLSQSTHNKLLLIKLGKNQSNLVRLCVAVNFETPNNTLTQLSYDKDEYIREAVAKNSATSSETIYRLSFDKSYRVLAAVASNPLTSLDRLIVLSKCEEDSATRNNAISNYRSKIASFN